MKALSEEDDTPEIPLTPLIDMVFLLLVFFLVATTFARPEVDHTIQLPSTEGGAKEKHERQDLVINVRSDGSVVVGGALVEESGLRDHITGWKTENPGRRVEIYGDAKTPWEPIIKVFGLCKALEITDVLIPVLPPDASGGSA